MVLLRQLVKEQIEKVARGEDPMGVLRDPNHPIIDTKIDEDIWSPERAAQRYGRDQAEPASNSSSS